MTVVNEEVVAVAELCDWLNDGTTPEDLQPRTMQPWAKTYRISRSGRERFLKVLPPVQTSALDAMSKLSALFPEVVPQTLAVDASRGLLLLEHHGGKDLARDISHEQKQRILVTYARLQAEAVTNNPLLKLLPKLKTRDLVPSLLNFLHPEFSGTSSTGPATAKDFMSVDRCQYYFELFKARAGNLAELIAISSQLPMTINHCDLRAGNAAVRENNDVVIYDWDEAVAGPAGASLHNFFSGCSTPCELLLDPASARLPENEEARTLLASYLDTLTAKGYCDADLLQDCLPGSICAGVINYVLSYGRFVPPNDAYREHVGGIIRKRLNDLLKLADLLSISSRDEMFRIVADYEARERLDHACRAMAQYVERRPSDAEAVQKLTTLLSLPANREQARPTFLRLLHQYPENCVLHFHYGVWLLERLEFEESVTHLTQAVVHGATDDAVAKALSDAIEFRDVCHAAELPGRIPTIRVSADEQYNGIMGLVRRRLAVKLFREYGTLLIENAFSEQLVEQMHQEYLDRYQRYFFDQRHDDALRVGNKRFMVTVDVEGSFNSPDVYANPHVKPIISDILGESMIMGGFVSVSSLPGAEPMRVHKDHPVLFPESDNPDGLPSFAVTAIVPMLGFNAISGTTRVVKRSHTCSSKDAEAMEYQDPSAPRGSCLLMDYRLTHQGRGNQSDKVRPILTMIYHRPWFRDIVNYGKQEPLLMSDDAWKQVPEEHRSLFEWARPKKRS